MRAVKTSAEKSAATSASTLNLVNRHRQARDLLSRSNSVDALYGGARRSRPPRPRSACGTRVGRSVSAAALGPSTSQPDAGRGVLRPSTAGEVATSRQEYVQQLRHELHAAPRSSLATSGRSLSRHWHQSVEPPSEAVHLPDRPHADDGARNTAVLGPDVLQAQESAAAALARARAMNLDIDLCAGATGSSEKPVQLVAFSDDADGTESEQDFTEEELRLEREVEQALDELEAADAVAAALRQELENAADDLEISRRELLQLQGVVKNWERASEEGQKELAEREYRLEELLSLFPVATTGAGGQSLSNSTAGNTGQPLFSRGPSADRVQGTDVQVAEKAAATAAMRRDAVAAERARLVESQMTRLPDQVAEHEMSLHKAMEERRRLEQQVEALERERDALRASQRQSRSNYRSILASLRKREDSIAVCARQRETLERQLVHLRGEANGLRARLAKGAAAALAAASSAGDEANAASSGTANVASDGDALCRADEFNGSYIPEEDARSTSLRQQREVVDLWAELRACDEESRRLQTEGP